MGFSKLFGIKKQKSMVILAGLTALITICLITNAFLSFQYSNCLVKNQELASTNLLSAYQDFNFAYMHLTFLYTNFNILNKVYFNYTIEEGGRCETMMKSTIPSNCTKDWLELPTKLYQNVSIIQEKIISNQKKCNGFSLGVMVSLYAALALSLFTILYTYLIYREYKS